MKKIILSLALITGSLTAFGQETKAISTDENGNMYELKSDLPITVIPEQAILTSQGNVKTIDGIVIGYVVALENNGNIQPLTEDCWCIDDKKMIRQSQVGF